MAAPAASRTTPQQLGSLSRKHESNGNPGLGSSGRGDHGGRSYGAYQFSSRTGSAKDFTNWLGRTNPGLARDLAGKTPGTPAFDSAWKQTAARDSSGFLGAQHDFIQQKFYDPAAAKVKGSTGLDVSQRSGALRDVMWSTAVQHGQGGANTVFKNALAGRDPSKLTDSQIIDSVYAERGRRSPNGSLAHFGKSAPYFQRGVANRFQNERKDAQSMLAREGQGQGTPTQPAPGTQQPAPGSQQPTPTQPAPGSQRPTPTQPAPGTQQPAPGSQQPAPTQPAPGTQQPQAPPQPMFRDPLVARGDRGQDVRKLQQTLRQNGINPGPVDGIFGPRTERAVRQYQTQQGLKVDGLVGQQTSGAMSRPSGTGSTQTPTRPTNPTTPGQNGSTTPAPTGPTTPGQTKPTTPAPTGPTTPGQTKPTTPAPTGPTTPTTPSPTGPTTPTNPPRGTGSVPEGTAQFQSTQNAGARNQMKTGQITVNGNTYNFRSGGHGKGNLPPGQYTVTPHLNSRSERGFSVGGVGWSFAVSDKFDPRVNDTRGLLRIHPDGGTPGTQGCIGIVGDANTMRRFRDDMNAAIRQNGGRYTLNVR